MRAARSFPRYLESNLIPLPIAQPVCALSLSGLPPANIRRGDFFSLAADLEGGVNAVVGNPPFIRYQQFNGPIRERASAVLRRAGVHISELASSWRRSSWQVLLFFVPVAASRWSSRWNCATRLMQSPSWHSSARSFRSVQFISFERRLFPELNQDTLLLLADSSGGGEARFSWKHLPDRASLASQVEAGRIFVKRSRQTRDRCGLHGSTAPDRAIPSKSSRKLYASVKKHTRVIPLGTAADVGIGYVTGANQFFHLSEQDAVRHEIPPKFLRRAVFRGRALAGLRFTDADWEIEAGRGGAGYLLTIPRRGSLPAPLRRYIEIGERSGVHSAYKCRVRTPWYAAGM